MFQNANSGTIQVVRRLSAVLARCVIGLMPGPAEINLKVLLSTAVGVFFFTTTAWAKPQTAATALINKISAMRHVKSWRANFICEKRLAVLRHPFISSGVMAVARPDHVRFDTRTPYRSCVILSGNTVFLRGQTNRHWHAAGQGRAQAIGLIMDQMAAWALGRTGSLQRNYRITGKSAAEPSPPEAVGNNPAKKGTAVRMCTFFTLIPRHGLAGRAISRLTLGFLRHSARLAYFAIYQKNGDRQMYWIRAAEINPRLPANYFKPAGPP